MGIRVNARTGEVVEVEEVTLADPPTPEELRARLRPLSRIQAFLLLEEQGVLTEEEAEQALAGNAIPSGIGNAVDGLVTNGHITAAARKEFRFRFLGFTEVDRMSSMLPILFAAAGLDPTDEELDGWWNAYLAR